jgi:hypothetical protein
MFLTLKVIKVLGQEIKSQLAECTYLKTNKSFHYRPENG